MSAAMWNLFICELETNFQTEYIYRHHKTLGQQEGRDFRRCAVIGRIGKEWISWAGQWMADDFHVKNDFRLLSGSIIVDSGAGSWKEE